VEFYVRYSWWRTGFDDPTDYVAVAFGLALYEQAKSNVSLADFQALLPGYSSQLMHMPEPVDPYVEPEVWPYPLGYFGWRKAMRKLKGWQRGMVICGGIVLLCILCAVLNNALPEQPPERGFKIEDLLIDESSFPPGWTANVINRPPSAPLGGQVSIERISVDFHNLQGVAVEEIHRYTSISVAANEFKRVVLIEFPSGAHWSTWELPEGFHYQSPYANCIQVGCARETWQGISIEFCRMVGQYEEYIVRFGTKISPDYMTHTDFEVVVQAIDERMGHYLGKKLASPTP